MGCVALRWIINKPLYQNRWKRNGVLIFHIYFSELYTGWEIQAMTNNHKYEIIIYWSEEDEAFIAEIPEFAGCAADGSTYYEAF